MINIQMFIDTAQNMLHEIGQALKSPTAIFALIAIAIILLIYNIVKKHSR